MGIFKTIEKFFRRRLMHREEFVEQTSQRLINFVAHSAFQEFKDKPFRGQFNFEKQAKVEQDRLFNELEVTALCLLLFVLEDAQEWGSEEEKPFWESVRQKTVSDFLNWMASLGIAQKYINLWKKVVEMRYQEYKEDLPKIYRTSGIADPEFVKSDQERRKNSYTRLMTVSIGAIHHLRKGKTSPKDPFFKELRTWLEVLNQQLEEKIFE